MIFPAIVAGLPRFALPLNKSRSGCRGEIRRVSGAFRGRVARRDSTARKRTRRRECRRRWLSSRFKTTAAANEKRRVGSGTRFSSRGPADALSTALWRPCLHGRRGDGLARQRCDAVKSAGAIEDVLRFAESFGQARERVRAEAEIGIGRCEGAVAHGVNGGFAADATAGRGEEVTAQAVQIGRGFGIECGEDYVGAIGGAVLGAMDSRDSISDAVRMRPSVKRKPAASSRSWPGVRMVTEMG